jgi:methionine-rich copper-binding protein CopC
MAGVRRRLGLILVSLVLVPSSARAHSNTVETNPVEGAALKTLPAEATVSFNEPPKTSDVVLARPDGRVNKLATRVVETTVRARLPADGPRGAYTLSYRVVSADGHPVSGSVRFSVSTGPAPSAPTADASPTVATNSTAAEPARGPLAPVVIGLGVFGVVAMVLVARSVRR